MGEKTVLFQMEMTIDKAYLRKTWKPLAKLKKTRWLLALLPAVCLAYTLYLWAGGGTIQMGIPIMAGIFLLFALMLPSLAISQLLAQYRQYKADGPRRISLLSDGVETELVKYGNTLFHPYAAFDHVEEDDASYSLAAGNGQKIILPKGPCLTGDPSQVKAFLEERMAACRAEAAALEDAEDDDPTGESAEEAETGEE